MRKILFVINPAAGKGKGLKAIPKIRQRFEKFDYEIIISKEVNGITALVQEELHKNYTDVIAVGGDGTLGEVINGIIGKDIKVGAIPLGSGNDFIKTLGLSEDFETRLTAIEKGRTEELYVPSVNEHYFINVLGWGVDAEIIKEKNKNIIREGKLNYLFSTLKMLWIYQPKEATVYIDDKKFTKEVYLVAVGNGQFIGNGMKVCPGGNPREKAFEICVVEKMPLRTLLRHFPKIFKGTHGTVQGIHLLKGHSIRVRFPEKTVIQEDGTLRQATEILLKKEKKIEMII
ncbi:diacylglycerol/lipid kinase family protein [Isachenkonia alkalipeptolytica]|nr:diacylglycerol kinase family protein [Isachenkonia alkalipeptolytica]